MYDKFSVLFLDLMAAREVNATTVVLGAGTEGLGALLYEDICCINADLNSEQV